MPYAPSNHRLEGPQAGRPDGDKLGTIDEVYLDRPDRPARVARGQDRTVRHEAQLRPARRGGRRRATRSGCPFEKAQVKDGPSVEADGELSHDEEPRLYRHYGH